MSLHPDFPTSPYAPLIPEQRWFPAAADLRDYFLAPFGPRPVGKTNDSKTDLGELIRTADGVIWIVETKGRQELDLPRKMQHLRQWCEDANAAEAGEQHYDFAFVDQEGFEQHQPKTFAALAASFAEYKG